MLQRSRRDDARQYCIDRSATSDALMRLMRVLSHSSMTADLTDRQTDRHNSTPLSHIALYLPVYSNLVAAQKQTSDHCIRIRAFVHTLHSPVIKTLATARYTDATVRVYVLITCTEFDVR